jgi:DNA polymerase V
MGNYNLDIKSKEKIAILDCNNFYVSCERLFNPSLEEKATVVLSNNDGCIIARSQEVKDIGIKMGQPLFKLDDNTKQNINKFSSNYALYGDISDRISNILKRIVKKVEVYSIDESFLDLSDIEESKIKEHIDWIKSTIEKLTGIPVSIGVAPNKTLAKLCNKLSKTDKSLNGTCSYWDIEKEKIYSLPVDEIWGIGRKWSKKLKSIGVENVKQFLDLQTIQVKKMFHVTGLRTWYELNEVLCHPISTNFKKPKMITASRSFGSTQWNPLQIKNAFWTHLQATHKKLIKENLLTYRVNLFITTNRFNDNYSVWTRQIVLSQGTNQIDNIWNEICNYLDDIPVKLWYKCGIVLSDLKPSSQKQIKIFNEEFKEREKPYVKDQLWMTRREFLTPEYTTNWDDLPMVF